MRIFIFYTRVDAVFNVDLYSLDINYVKSLYKYFCYSPNIEILHMSQMLYYAEWAEFEQSELLCSVWNHADWKNNFTEFFKFTVIAIQCLVLSLHI